MSEATFWFVALKCVRWLMWVTETAAVAFFCIAAHEWMKGWRSSKMPSYDEWWDEQRMKDGGHSPQPSGEEE